MGLTYEYLRAHIAPELWLEHKDEYNSYPSEGKGGPLLLYLMIHHLIAANDSIAITLSRKTDTVKISANIGEDVGEAITHLRAIVRRLQHMRRRDASGNEIDLVPLDLTKRLYSVFQTSSNTEFNGLFHNLYTREYAESLITGSSAWSGPDRVLTLAQNLYTRLCADGNWLGVDQHKATFPVLTSPKAATAFLGNVKCHNSGGPHVLRNFPKTPDQAKIDANKKRLVAIKKLAKKETSSKSKGSNFKSSCRHLLKLQLVRFLHQPLSLRMGVKLKQLMSQKGI
jgi:hypothetical protein